MTNYIVKQHLILYKEVKADSPEEAEEKALNHDHIKELTNSPEEIAVLEVDEVSK